jgi:beta-glucosidase
MISAFSEAAERVRGGADHHTEAAQLVAQMTLAEKLGCLDGDTPFWPGLADMGAGGYYRHPWPAAVVDRLGVPGIQFADGPRGAVIADGTAFPVSMARGAMFDAALEERVGDVIGLELRASGATYTGAVCMNLLRHPAWGRAQETYGEDPHHVGRMAAAFVCGLERHVMACMKHFAVNSMENTRFTVDVSADERALHEVYLPHFRHVADEGIASVMSAYNSLNGEWCGENETLLTTILRDEWGWDGFVISDFIFGLRDAVASVEAGLDIEMPFRQQRADVLGDAVGNGRLDKSTIDRCVQRVVATLLHYADVVAVAPDPSIVNCAPHRALAREVAAASTVMLRNEGRLLPVDAATIDKLVVVGRLAAVPNLGDGGSSDVKSTTVVTPLDGITTGFPDATVTHLVDVSSEADRALVADADLVVVIAGYTKRDEGEYIDSAGTMALAGDLFPAMDHPVLGFPPCSAADTPGALSPDDRPAEGEPAHDEDGDIGGMAPGGDRVSLRLSDADEAMIAAVASVSDRVAAVVQCGSAVMMPWAESVRALLVSWYPGVEGGHALTDMLTGAVEPGGRLPFAIPIDVDHLVPFDKDATTAVYDLLHGQWKLDADGNAAQFPFGAGHGYTIMRIGGVGMTDEGSTIGVDVENIGDRRGSAVVFAFGGLPDSEVVRPLRRLIGFARVDLAAGESVRAGLDLDWSQLDVRRDETWWTEPGDYVVTVGLDASDHAHVVPVVR